MGLLVEIALSPIFGAISCLIVLVGVFSHDCATCMDAHLLPR